MRASGILMPVASLPSNYGIGAFSEYAYKFIDALKEAGQKYWQILPLGPTGYGDSPYQSFSTFAGNPYYIDLDQLIEKNLITKAECENSDYGNNLEAIDYEKLYHSRFKLLYKAYERSKLDVDSEFKEFAEEHRSWLEDYSLYMAIKNSKDDVNWMEWDEDIRYRDPGAMELYRELLKDQIEFYQFIQFHFFKQWKKLKTYANSNGIKIIGDIPIYVALDSADCWANTELFQFNEDKRLAAVAGCPPDGFSPGGQVWGNPLYRWEYHKETEFSWWINRIAHCFLLYDVLRVDHFRGFDQYFSIPYGDSTAVNGEWLDGPGYDIFKAVKEKLGEAQIIAEDLGFLTPSVEELLTKTAYPGMKVLQFAFDSREESDYLPHNYDKNCVVYTGTHDNQTTKDWYTSLEINDKKLADDYINLYGREDQICFEFIRLALASTANLAIIPMQDYLELGDIARINTPSTLGGNWIWRMKDGAFSKELIEKIKKMVKIYGR